MMKATPRCWQTGRKVSAARAMAESSTPFNRSWKAATSPPSSAARSSLAKIAGCSMRSGEMR